MKTEFFLAGEDDPEGAPTLRSTERSAALRDTLPPDPWQETVDDANGGRQARRAPSPGLVLVWSDSAPRREVLPLSGGSLELGRVELSALGVHDERVSRRHVEVRWDGARWQVQDRGSRNGTWLDGAQILGATSGEGPRVLRIGRSLFTFTLDAAGRSETHWPGQSGAVGSARLWAAWERVVKAAELGDTLLITGETGSGKELAARLFHEQGPKASGPFVAVNCAAIPHGLAEGLLFGSKKGAYSGAHRDTEGYLAAAHGGTLFLDEIGDLDLPLQSKLLRALETREVFPLGATRPRKVDVRICSATHVDLAARVGGSFRHDLFFRLGTPRVTIPPLRERLEEVPWHIAAEVARWAPSLRVSTSLVQACLLRSWPGNVRELKLEVRGLVQEAVLSGSSTVELGPLPDEGPAPASPLSPPEPSGWPPRASPPQSEVRATADDPYREVLLEALRKSEGNVAEAARRLQMHRTQLRRELVRYGIEPSAQSLRALSGKRG